MPKKKKKDCGKNQVSLKIEFIWKSADYRNLFIIIEFKRKSDHFSIQGYGGIHGVSW